MRRFRRCAKAITSIQYATLHDDEILEPGVILRSGAVGKVMARLVGTKGCVPMDFAGYGYVVNVRSRRLVPATIVDWAAHVVSQAWWLDDGLTLPTFMEMGEARSVLQRERPELLLRAEP